MTMGTAGTDMIGVRGGNGVIEGVRNRQRLHE